MRFEVEPLPTFGKGKYSGMENSQEKPINGGISYQFKVAFTLISSLKIELKIFLNSIRISGKCKENSWLRKLGEGASRLCR